MGVQNLNKLIKEFAPDAITTIKDIRDLELWRVGVDCSMSVYQWCSAGKRMSIVNKDGKYINHIQGAFFRTLKMILAGIHPVYVFDGRPPEMKGATIAKRKELRDAGALRVPHEVFVEVAKLLELMGVLCIQAPSEAEAQCAAYTLTGVLDGVATEDTDAIAFGSRRMIRGLDTAAKSMAVVEHAKVLEGLSINNNQFIDLCILLGCDYLPTLPGIGYKRALMLIRKWGSIEKILQEEKIKAPDNFDYVGARNLFLQPLVNTDKPDPEVKKLSAVDIAKLRQFLIDVHGLEPSRVDKSLKSLAKFHGVA